MLKGLNRSAFENKLVGNIRKAVARFGNATVYKSQARIYIEPKDDAFLFERAMEQAAKVFGVVSVSPVMRVRSDFEEIKEKTAEMLEQYLQGTAKRNLKSSFSLGKQITFKVETRRGDKRFPMESMEVSRELGAFILDAFPHLKVDVHQPDFVFYVDVRESTYLFFEVVPAVGGMPIGTNGKATLLLSGGIDSPVAGWMVAKRGVYINAVHFYSYPYTSERAKEKVVSLAKTMSEYCEKIQLFVVPFTEIQLRINERCRHELLTLVMRRVMMKIAERIAKKGNSQALITGESIGQVASQTMHGLVVTDDAVDMPVFRPLIGMDKNEVVTIAKRIGTYETSVLPYEDCCTTFVPKHPKTKPKLDEVVADEEKAALEELIEAAIANVELITLEAKKG